MIRTLRRSNSRLSRAVSPSSVVQTGVKSLGCENRTPQRSPSHSWNRIGPCVVSAVKSGARSPSRSAMPVSSSSGWSRRRRDAGTRGKRRAKGQCREIRCLRGWPARAGWPPAAKIGRPDRSPAASPPPHRRRTCAPGCAARCVDARPRPPGVRTGPRRATALTGSRPGRGDGCAIVHINEIAVLDGSPARRRGPPDGQDSPPGLESAPLTPEAVQALHASRWRRTRASR